MKSIFLQIILYPLTISVFAQKPPISTNSFKEWTFVNSGKICNNGKFACYTINNKPLNGETMIVTATDNSWRKQLIEHQNGRFSDDSRFIFTQKGDTLNQYLLKSDVAFHVPKCTSYDLIQDSNTEWLVYLENNILPQLIVKNLKTDKISCYRGVYQYITNPGAANLLLLAKSKMNDFDTLKWVDLKTAKIKNIYVGNTPHSIIFDDSSKNIAFTSTEKDGMTLIWHFNESYGQCQVIASDGSKEILRDHQIDISSQWGFSKDGQYLFFTQKLKVDKDEIGQTTPEVWSYRDAYLLTRYKRDKKDAMAGRNLTMIDLNARTIRVLLKGLQKPASQPGATGDHFLVKSSFGDNGEALWNNAGRIDFEVCNFRTGKVDSLIGFVPYAMMPSISPNGKYVIYFRRETRQFSLYNVSAAQTFQFELLEKHKNIRPFNPSVVGWSEKRNDFYIQGRYHLWEFDPENIANGRILTGNKDSARVIYCIGTYFKNYILPYDKDIVIFGLDEESKQSSLSILNIAKHSFKLLYKTDEFVGGAYSILAEDMFNKAAKASAYLLKFETTERNPNYTFTKNFKTFTVLSEEYPEKKFNWLSSELITYSDSVGRTYKAIIYKPENFIPTKKYPVIFQYYQYVSDELHQYIAPDSPPAVLNIPLFVSAGYIVVRPDVPIIMGEPGNRALWSVEGAAKYMSDQTYVDSSRMGVIAHSLGGFETYYIVTHSKRFAAAVSEAGTSNMIQQANEVWIGVGSSYHNYNTTIGFSAKLDSQPEIFLKNSPILFAKNITSPLLIVHNPEDKSVPISQGLQMFVQLRSLQKPVWMLQYPGEGHNLVKLENRLDHQARLLDFFDHYLKQKPAPSWMIRSMR